MKFHKLTAGLLALSMVGTFVPASAPMLTVLAEEEIAPTEETENGAWTFDEGTGTLTILDEEGITYFEWLDFANSIKTLIIEDGVTTIWHYAFEGCTALTSVTIPNSVTNIEFQAFRGCTALTSVTIPDSVTSIGESAFYGCTSLIGEGAFYGCTSLTSVTIPDGVTSIGGQAFYETPWLTAKQADNPLVIVNDILIDGTTCEGDIIIPDGVTSIGGCAFYGCPSLTSVTIPDSVTSIDYSAFRNCKSLTSVTIPDSVTSIGYSAFCDCTSLTSVTIPDSVTSIGGCAFWGCDSLTEVTVLNPDCEFDENDITFGNGYAKNGAVIFTGTISGYDNSTAQAYAEKHGCTFQSLSAAPESPAPEDTAAGDVSGDGKVDSSDAADLLIALAKLGAGEDAGLTDTQKAAADADGNGELNAADATIILQYAAFLGAGGTGTLGEFLASQST